MHLEVLDKSLSVVACGACYWSYYTSIYAVNKGTPNVRYELIQYQIMSLSKFSNLFLDDLPIHRFSTNDLNVYLQDIINQLLYIKESGDPVNVRLFLSKYFEHVVNGTHTIHREFKYISAIPYNRMTFLFNLWNAFTPLKDKGFTVEEFYTIVQLFCFDFPVEILSYCQKTLNIVHNSTTVYSYKDLFCVFQFHFYFEVMFHQFVNALISELTKNESVVLTNRQKDKSELVDISSGGSKCSHKSVASECCFKTNILVNLPNKYVNSIEFINFTRGLYKESTLLLPPKLVMHKCAKTYLFHSEFNLYSLFASLATDHLLIKEIGFPQVYGS
ncbi:unnamed protein product [Schistosoma spindalis]|nr:unnamed protein product [Schistosoma spindale]